MGWLFETHGQASSQTLRAATSSKTATMRRINKSFPLIALYSLLLPFLLGFALSGGSLVAGGLSALLWGGLVRIFLVHHITWSINSICHFFGRRRFETDDESTNVFWLALPSLGEAWHHNHHAFPQLGLPRAALVRVRPLRVADPRARARRAGMGRRHRHARAGTREAEARYRLGMNLIASMPVKPRLRGVSMPTPSSSRWRAAWR